MTLSILDEVRQIIADILDLPVDQINAESSPSNLENWDSLQHLNLILALEQNSGLQFSPEEIEQMHSVHMITMFIEQKRSPSKEEKPES